MKIFGATLALFAGVSMAGQVCPSGLLGGSPACCATGVLGLLGLDCSNRESSFWDPSHLCIFLLDTFLHELRMDWTNLSIP